jgi:hypothetical protein
MIDLKFRKKIYRQKCSINVIASQSQYDLHIFSAGAFIWRIYLSMLLRGLNFSASSKYIILNILRAKND